MLRNAAFVQLELPVESGTCGVAGSIEPGQFDGVVDINKQTGLWSREQQDPSRAIFFTARTT